MPSDALIGIVILTLREACTADRTFVDRARVSGGASGLGCTERCGV